MQFLTEYNIENRVGHSKASGLKCEDKTLAQQQFKDQCNINVLFARYLETGEMPQVLDGISYGNFEGIFDFQTAMNAVRTAQGLFSQLPARIKNRFDNDPQKLLEFLADPENREEAEFLKLIDRKEQPSGQATAGSPEGRQEGTPGAAGAPAARDPNQAAQGPGQGPAGKDPS